MKYSKLFGKTIRRSPNEAKIDSHKLLHKAGYIRSLVAGRYSFLPLGFRVWNKIIQIIDEEMTKIGSQRVVAPTLHPIELWKATARDEAFGPGLMRLKDRRGSEFVLGATAEGVMLDLVMKFKPSYRDLPIVIHQFSQKFRDELRARGGLLRVREFVMKDAYSFHATKRSLDKTYQDMYNAYLRILERLGLKGIPVEAYSGAIGGKHCHEFMVESPVGEDRFLVCSDCGYTANKEKAEFVRENINLNDKMKPLKIIDQPEWVKTMEDNVKHYGLPQSRFLKNVVYKDGQGKMIVAVIRGDLEVNEVKLMNLLKKNLVPATEEDIVERLKSKPGWVHSWGNKAAFYVGDTSLRTVKNLIGGQKQEKTDSINVNYPRDFKVDVEGDIGLAKNGYLCGRCKKGILKEKRGIEFGHVFKLDDFYTKPVKGTFVDKNGKERLMLMGCYGIGIGRAMAIVVEKHHDDKGIIWPKSIAPFQVHLLAVEMDNKKVRGLAENVYMKLLDSGIDVLYDDRVDVSPGVRLVDADLIGIPIRLVVSQKIGEKIEWKQRSKSKKELLTLEQTIQRLRSEK
jgi:prolyl-tRNA synthetase